MKLNRDRHSEANDSPLSFRSGRAVNGTFLHTPKLVSWASFAVTVRVVVVTREAPSNAILSKWSSLRRVSYDRQQWFVACYNGGVCVCCCACRSVCACLKKKAPSVLLLHVTRSLS